MNDRFYHTMTPFDQYTSTGSIQMTKLLIPFLPPQTQRMMAVYVKFFEFKHTMSFFQGMRQEAQATDAILNSLKPYMSSSDIESFDQMMNMMSMMKEMQNMTETNFDFFSMMGGSSEDNNNELQKEGESLD